MEIKNDNYVAIQGWMVNDLHLSGSELIIYALIYGFSQDGESWFSGSSSYVGAWCGISRQSASANLKKLTDDKLLEKESFFGIGDRYRVSRNFTPTCQETLQGVLRNLTGGCKETLHNTIYNTGNTNKTSAKEKKKIAEDERFQIFYESYPKKTDKTDARKVFNTLIKSGVTLDTILSKLKVYENMIRDNKTDKQYIRGPARFLRTLDDYEIPETNKKEKTVSLCPKCGVELRNMACPQCFTNYDLEGKEL